MSYNDFDLKKVKQELGVTLTEKQNAFSAIKNIDISFILTEILAENIPLVRAINTEKARSELNYCKYSGGSVKNT